LPPVAAARSRGVQSTAIYARRSRSAPDRHSSLDAAIEDRHRLTMVGAKSSTWTGLVRSAKSDAKALLAGLTAGLLAGIIGQGFYNHLRLRMVDAISRVVAWAILGGMMRRHGPFVPTCAYRRLTFSGMSRRLRRIVFSSSRSRLPYLEQYMAEGFVNFLAS